MLTVKKVAAPTAGGYADYLEGKTTATSLGDYYLKDGERVEAPGRWVSGAQAVGAEASVAVRGDQLRALMAVRRPDTGELLRRAGSSGEAVAALDATFSAPKSVSAVWALADPGLRQRIEHAHEAAVDRTLTYAIGQVPMIRIRTDPNTVVHTGAADLVATSWRHTTARAVDGHTPDPQLHSHVLLHAAVRRDGRIVAIDSRTLFTHRREIGAAYRTELARELHALGFQIVRGTGRGGRYFEIDGVPDALTDRWSSRHKEVQAAIRQRLGDTGRVRLTPGEERQMAVSTRSSKRPVTNADLDRQWRNAASEVGVAAGELQRLRRTDPVELDAVDRRGLLNALTEFDSTFPDRDARAVTLERSAGAPIDKALAQLNTTREDHGILRLADGTQTTAWHRARERATVATFQSLAENRVEPIRSDLVAQSLEAVERNLGGGVLSAEQRDALALACGGRQVVMIEGQAGTGKSTLLQAVALAHQAAGREVIVTSTAGAAAERLAADLAAVGVNAPGYSTAALQQAVASGRVMIAPDTTIIHDEAALASTREQHHLTQVIEEAGARLVVVGDPGQSGPVGAGGLWSRLEQIAAGQQARVELTTNLRAHDPEDRRDQKLFRDGDQEQALHGYQIRGRIDISAGQAAAELGALSSAHHDRKAGLETLVIAQTSNEHLDELNAQAQALRLRDGDLAHDSIAIPHRPYELHAGDHVQIRQTLRHQEGQVLRNGTSATIAGVDPAGALTLRLADGSKHDLDSSQIEQADIRLAYVQHPFPAQGVTSDTTHLIVSEHATQEGTYVALTRARQQTEIHASYEALTRNTDEQRVQRLAELVSRTEPDIPSIAVPLEPEQSLKPMLEPTIEIERNDSNGWEL